MKIFTSKKSTHSKESFLMEKEEIFLELSEKKGSSLLLGKYSLNEVLVVLKKKNYFKEARKRNLWPLEYEMDSSEFPPLQRFKIFYKEKKQENMIVDLKIREGELKPRKEIASAFSISEFKFLILDWLTLQNPLQAFSPEKPPLPGQTYPSLSLGKSVIDLFIYLARLTRSDGILVYPAYFHNAILFSRAFHFLNPEKKAQVLAIKKSFPDISFKQLAWIVHLNCLRQNDGKIFEWKAEEQVLPLDKGLKKYFDSKIYREKAKITQKILGYSIDWECFRKKIKKEGAVLNIQYLFEKS